MSQISSINFKKSNPIQTQHNDRNLPPNYLIGGAVECNYNYKEALILKNKIIKEAIENYTKKTGQKFQAKSYEWSAVVNIKPNTTLNDLENLANHFQEKYGFQCYQIAIHRDEGHISDDGEKVINHHAHLEFITLDKQTGKNNYRRELITPKILRQIQTEVAEILQMQRGEDKRISKRERIEPRKYAQMKENEKKALKEKSEVIENRTISWLKEVEKNKSLNAELESVKNKLLTKIEYKEIIENFRKSQVGKGLNKEFFRDLSNLKKNFEAINEQELSKLLNDILDRHLQIEKENQTMKEIIGKARCSEDGSLGMLVETEIQQGKSEFVVNEIKQNITYYALKDANVKGLQQEIERLKKENLELKQSIEKRDNFINNLGKMLNFQGLNYATPINELERYLKPKEQKNDDLYQKENKNDLNSNYDNLNSLKIEQKIKDKKEELEKINSQVSKEHENDLILLNKIINIQDQSQKIKALIDSNFEIIANKYAEKINNDWKEFDHNFKKTWENYISPSTGATMALKELSYRIKNNIIHPIHDFKKLEKLKEYLDFLNKTQEKSKIKSEIEALMDSKKYETFDQNEALRRIQEAKNEILNLDKKEKSFNIKNNYYHER